MGSDESALLRLWQVKRGEISRRTSPANLISSWGSPRSHKSALVREKRRGRPSRTSRAGSGIRDPLDAATLDGVVEGSGAVFEAKFMLPWS